MRTDDTIAALATAPGPAPRAILRLSGPQTPQILHALTGHHAEAREARPARLHLPATTDLPGLPPVLSLPVGLLNFPAPHSYTAEHAAEILLPGNPALAQRALHAALDAGARLATPGEFTARAHLAGRLTIEQAEGVAALIAADRDEQLESARRLLSGDAGRRYADWADRLADLAALVEAGVDFTDQEDVVPIPPPDLARALEHIDAEIAHELGPLAPAQHHDHAPRVALAGPPNAGKSTLFNALLGRRRAITADAAGTTRDVLDEPLDLTAHAPTAGPVRLLDLPGLDPAAEGEIDTAAQARAKDALHDADVVIHCDPAGRFDPAGLPHDRPTLRVRTKADLPGPGGDRGDTALAVCALDGWRLDALRRAIADAALAPAGAAAVVPRHRRALADARAALADARAHVDPDAHALREPELVACALRAALDAVGSIAGRISPDDVLGRVFAGFCIGK